MQPDSDTEPRPSDRGWLWMWILSAGVAVLIVSPTAYRLYQLKTFRESGDLPRALTAVKSLSDGFFGPLLNSWLEEVGREMREEVIADNLQSIQRLVPDTEESAYAEMELGRLALSRGDAAKAILHLERYLKSGLGRDIDRARLEISEAYKEMKRAGEAEAMLKTVLGGTTDRDIRAEAAYRLGELYQFHLNRSHDAVVIYRSALSDTSLASRWRNDIYTNLSLLKD